MQKADIGRLARLLHKLSEATKYATRRCEIGEGSTIVPLTAIEKVVSPAIALARICAGQLDLQSTLDRIASRTGYFSRLLLQSITFQELKPQLDVLREAIESDLEKREFVLIRSEKVTVLNDMPAVWRTVWKAIPTCKVDAEEAIHSYCLDRHTASVFHSVRVSEHGLRFVAKKVGVKLTDKGKPQPIEFATWDKVIVGIRGKITAAHALPQGARKTKRLQFFSEAADCCTYIRDIWRNEVSHTRKHYSEAEALRVLNRVRDFMRLLADAPK